MLETIPKAIRDEFTIINKGVKYPTYPDQEFQNSILDDQNLNNIMHYAIGNELLFEEINIITQKKTSKNHLQNLLPYLIIVKIFLMK